MVTVFHHWVITFFAWKLEYTHVIYDVKDNLGRVRKKGSLWFAVFVETDTIWNLLSHSLKKKKKKLAHSSA